MRLNDRQKKIVTFAEKTKVFQNKDLVSFFNQKYSRETIKRDLAYLHEKNILDRNHAGAYVSYSLASSYNFLKEIDVAQYFDVSYRDRDVQESFNFDIFTILEEEIFSLDERKHIKELQRKFVTNFSQYNSQTLINKEFERIMIEFSWKSSAIEGNTYSLLATEALLKENVVGKGKTKEETQMILNHKDAFNESIQNRARFLELDYGDIEYMHSVLTKDLGITKNIRNIGVGITGTKYKPLSNRHQIKEALEKMVSLVNGKDSFFEKAFLVLLLLSYIQAFEDGNKRVARMTTNAVLLAHNSIPLSYRIVEVEEYKKAALLFYEQNNIFYFKSIFIEQFEDAVEHYFN